MPTLTDTTLIIRCPHCMVGIEFRPMIAYTRTGGSSSVTVLIRGAPRCA
jgi:hypothetical protein